MTEKFHVYVLHSEKHNKYYVGSTSDIKKRLSYHNSSLARWTKRYQPWKLFYSEEFDTRGEAVRRERELKAYKDIKRLFIRV